MLNLERLRLLRESKKMSQLKLGIELGGVAQETVSGYEIDRHEPNLETLWKLADIFNVSVDYLIGRSDTKLAISSTDLSQEEVELLAQFRQLPKNKKERLLGMAEALSET